MATKLRKTISREVRTPRGPLTVEVAPEGVRIREKGRRTSYTVGWGAIYSLGAKLEARELEARELERAER